MEYYDANEYEAGLQRHRDGCQYHTEWREAILGERRGYTDYYASTIIGNVSEVIDVIRFSQARVRGYSEGET